MAYYKVLIKETFTYRVLVEADNTTDAFDKATIENNNDWGEAIDVDVYPYEVTELVENPNAN